MYFIALSSFSQLIYSMERFSHNNIDLIWKVFIISTSFFITLLIWLIVGVFLNKRQDIVVTTTEVKFAAPNDPFARTEVNSFQTPSSFMDDNSSRNSYLISPSHEDEADLLEAESRLYEVSMIQDDRSKDYDSDDNYLNKDEYYSSAPDSSFTEEEQYYEDYSTPYSVPKIAEEKPPSLSIKSKGVIPLDIKPREIKSDFLEEESNIERNILKITEIPSKKEGRSLDIPVKGKAITPREDMEEIKSSGDSFKIDLPKKVLTSKSKNEDLSRTRTAPLQAIRIDLPQKDNIYDKKKSQSSSSEERINLPRKQP